MKKSQKDKKNNDILLVFKYAKLCIDVNPEYYDKKQQKKILSIVNQASKEIYIDKTYVTFKNSKYEKTFISEEGWNSLCSLIKATNYGKKCSKDENSLIQDSYKAILIQYIYYFLEDLGYDISNIFIDILEKTKFMVQIFEDNIKDFYPGKWQTWECNQ